jgi:alanyl-tRNA synthetase
MKKIKDRKELIKLYIDFFKSKNHKVIPNSSLIPENDPTVLFTTAGMHPLVPYLLGQPNPLGKRLVNVQRCIRTTDIINVGDEVHHTFFEMLGNWSLGDYWKKEAIEYSFEFLTKVLEIPIDKLTVTCFIGDKNSAKDEESAKTWINLGIPSERVVFLGKEDNWWGPAGKTGPCGPDTEMFFWAEKTKPSQLVTDNNFKGWVEIGNNVLLQYNKDEKGNYILAKQKNIDFGGGVERTLAILNGFNDNYLTSIWRPIINKITDLSGKRYGLNKETTKAIRIIADHIKASVFIISDGVCPSNTEQGYVLRRLIRRAIIYGKKIGLKNFTELVAKPVFDIYDDYPSLQKNKENILCELKKEECRFLETLEGGIKIFEKQIKDKKILSGKDAFLLYQSYGFPIEITKELCIERKIKLDEDGFIEEEKKHQDLSRTASAGKFKSGLADNSEATTRLHTATHLLNEALKIVLNDKNIHQKGSNITSERLRFDFNINRKITPEELKKIEDLVNKKIKENIEINCCHMDLKQAKNECAEGVFEDKYGEKVSVYKIGDFNKEICAGPHVKNTSELGHFKIIKEESVASGVRRIKAILE